ncbi:MAG: hypothetical protein GWM92_04875 [Gemmatimonadetes bacterium]|nr:hypothetical protein [Gemmatimonadota bacterium]NIR77904.1 hypothetical protein [Gemmatimonadota bacterium]NIT86454.1 hypothetical protein [Gemmatimonadota bacterium]NIU30293.1 hypothetical protein [Gemmatimonadota bacterium]NIU35192.1 hypothetical protein [Gemmatimonadota bacterium]
MDKSTRLARIFRIAHRALSETSRDPEVVARAAWDALREIGKLARQDDEGDPMSTELDVNGQGNDAGG